MTSPPTPDTPMEPTSIEKLLDALEKAASYYDEILDRRYDRNSASEDAIGRAWEKLADARAAVVAEFARLQANQLSPEEACDVIDCITSTGWLIADHPETRVIIAKLRASTGGSPHGAGSGPNDGAGIIRRPLAYSTPSTTGPLPFLTVEEATALLVEEGYGDIADYRSTARKSAIAKLRRISGNAP